MNSIFKSIVLGASLIVAGASTGQAADLYGRGSYKDMPAYAPAVATKPSWYVRFDGAYGVHDDPVMVENGVANLTNPELGGAWSLGAGVGRYFTSNIRGDLTYDHRFEADASGRIGTAGGVRAFGLKSDLFLANLYYDFATQSRFTPYVGVGLGFVHHQTTEGTVTNPCGCNGIIDPASKWSAAGAFMAGVSVNLSRPQMMGGSTKDAPITYTAGRGLKLDIGYRFLYLGEATTGPIVVNAAPVSDDPTVEQIHAHEFRVGLRYEIQ